MLVHDARVVAAGPAGEREIPLHAFYLGLRTGAGLARDCSAAGLECLTTRES